MQASWIALVDSLEYGLRHQRLDTKEEDGYDGGQQAGPSDAVAHAANRPSGRQ